MSAMSSQQLAGQLPGQRPVFASKQSATSCGRGGAIALKLGGRACWSALHGKRLCIHIEINRGGRTVWRCCPARIRASDAVA